MRNQSNFPNFKRKVIAMKYLHYILEPGKQLFHESPHLSWMKNRSEGRHRNLSRISKLIPRQLFHTHVRLISSQIFWLKFSDIQLHLTNKISSEREKLWSMLSTKIVRKWRNLFSLTVLSASTSTSFLDDNFRSVGAKKSSSSTLNCVKTPFWSLRQSGIFC